MKKYRFCFPKSAFLIYALIILASIVSIVFSSLRLANVGKYASIHPAVDITTIVVFVIFVALIGYNLVASYYAFVGDTFVIAQLFSKKKIAREALCRFVLDEESSVAALYYLDPARPDVISYVTISLRKATMSSFVEELRAFRGDIAIEIISRKGIE